LKTGYKNADLIVLNILLVITHPTPTNQ